MKGNQEEWREEGGKEGGMGAQGTQEVGPGIDLSVHTETAPETSINIVFFFLAFFPLNETVY